MARTQKKAPAKAEASGKGKGTKKKRLTAREIADRNMRVISLILARVPQAQVAEEVDLSTRQVRAIWKEYSDAGKLNPKDEDPADYVRNTIEEMRALRTVLASKLPTAENLAALVGAVKAMAGLIADETALRQAVNYVPKNLGDLQVNFDVEFVVEVLAEILEENDVSDHVWQQIAEKLQEETGMAMSMN